MIEIQMTGGLALCLPETLAEITVEQYCEFLQGADAFTRWQSEAATNDAFVFEPGYQLERLQRMANMVADFASTSQHPVPASELFRLPAGDFEKSLRLTFGLGSLEDFDFDKSEATLYNIWAMILKIITDTRFRSDTANGFSFVWKGERYTIKPLRSDAFSGLTLPPDLSVQEAVEVLELRKKADALLTSKKHEAKNIQWELLHRQLAILALKEGEELPVDDLEMEQFASQRAAHFVGLDAETALQADFFLAGRLGLLKATLIVTSFSIPPDPEPLTRPKPEGSWRHETRRSPSASATAGYTSG